MGAASFLPQHRSSKLGHMLWTGWECGQKQGGGEKPQTQHLQQPPQNTPTAARCIYVFAYN